MLALDRLAVQEYQELAGGKVDSQGRLTGGELQPRKGIGNWHERETGNIMALKHKYAQGGWSGADDQPNPPLGHEPIALKRTVGAFHLENLADWLENVVGAKASIVEQIRSQSFDSLITGDVHFLRVSGIDPVYSYANEQAAFERNEPYLYVTEKGSVWFKKPDVTEELAEVPEETNLVRA